jgi:hypothetical protein
MLSDASSIDKSGAFALEILPSPSEDFLRKTVRRSLAMAIMCEMATVLIVVLSSYSRLPIRAWLGDYDTALAVSAIFPALGAYHYHNVYRRTKQGMEGEKRVIEFLKSKLDGGYFLINNVAYVNERGNKENIDHIVLGPNGIFALETKDYSGRITCKGRNWTGISPYGRSPSSQARGNAYWVKKSIDTFGASEPLKIWVEPIVVFSNPDVELERIDPEAEVVKLDKLVDFIVSYKGYDFSSNQLKAMGNMIIEQAQKT